MITLENIKGFIVNEDIIKSKNGNKKVIKKSTVLTEHGDRIKVIVESNVHSGLKASNYEINIKTW